MSFVACFRNHTSCQWEPSRQPIPLDYDLWLVNGNPDDDNNNPFTYQYSCDDQVDTTPNTSTFSCSIITASRHAKSLCIIPLRSVCSLIGSFRPVLCPPFDVRGSVDPDAVLRLPEVQAPGGQAATDWVALPVCSAGGQGGASGQICHRRRGRPRATRSCRCA